MQEKEAVSTREFSYFSSTFRLMEINLKVTNLGKYSSISIFKRKLSQKN